jgi:hypothetical protein
MAALVNHDCRPNSAMTYHGTLLTIRAVRDIAVGEEITINYSPVRLADSLLSAATSLAVSPPLNPKPPALAHILDSCLAICWVLASIREIELLRVMHSQYGSASIYGTAKQRQNVKLSLKLAW